MTALPEVPRWPHVVRMSPTLICIDGKLPQAFMHYAAPGERSYVSAEAYEAALARLRVAVETLNRATMGCIECNGQGQFRSQVNPVFLDDCPACADAREALSTIGEVPHE